ncbi:MAG: iron-containing alcohol dehydrogenase [Candidatus Hydrogenedentota bacterium]
MWTFTLPTRIVFGAGVAETARETAATLGQRPAVITDATLAALPHIQRIVESFGDAPAYTEVEPNPTTDNVDAAAAMLRENGCDAVVAIGGGSPLDCAKAAAVLALTADTSIRAYHSEGKALPADALPLIALPTTAGTGSEVTPFSVLDDRQKGVKGPIAGDALYPAVTLVDPTLTFTLPNYITACTGLDALSHALEGYWSRGHQPICDHLAKEAARLVFAHLELALTMPGHTGAREALSYAATLAGMAFQLPKNAMVHACSFPLSNRYHLPHGAACAFTMEFAIRLNAPHMGGRLDAFAHYCGFDSPEAMARRISELKALGGLPRTLADAGIPQEAVATLIDESWHPLIKNNPKEVTRDDLEAMYASLA